MGKRRTTTTPVDRLGWVVVCHARKVCDQSEPINLHGAKWSDSLSLECRSTKPNRRECKGGLQPNHEDLKEDKAETYKQVIAFLEASFAGSLYRGPSHPQAEE
jgi:hypothetical protein